VAIVTGGGRGIGRAYAERFLREGAAVLIADVDESSAQQTLRELGGIGKIQFARCDVGSSESAQACARAAQDTFGRIDVLVNNAALYGDWNMADQSEAYLERVFDINLHGVWRMTRAVAPQMVKQRHGRIINQASAAAYNYSGPPGETAFTELGAFSYSQTKWGVIGLTKFSAAQLGRYGITVNCIAPGVIATEATKKIVPAQILEQLAQKQVVPGVMNAEDLTGAAVYFASDESRFATGQVLVIDGGKYMPA
jgi:3-oxoacyl-[acyl-carrier protein] reductase